MEFYYRGVDRDVLVLKADGGIASTNAEDVVAQLTRIARSGIRKLVIDCAGLGYISSRGVGMLMHLHKTLWAAGGQVKVASVRGPVFRILDITNLARLFEIYPTVEEALGAFRRSSHQHSASPTPTSASLAGSRGSMRIRHSWAAESAVSGAFGSSTERPSR